MADGDNPHYTALRAGGVLVNTGMPAYAVLQGCCPQVVERLLALKRHWAQQREALSQRQKQLGTAGDREGAKLLKEPAAQLLQLQRAAQLFLGHLAAQPPGDSPHRPLAEWGRELAPACRQVDHLATSQPAAERALAEAWA